MSIPIAPWSEVDARLPTRGRALCACFDDDTVTVFAAHSREIGDFAVANGHFGGRAWSADRVTRFRLSLPRVMARSERGERDGKQAVLAIVLRRERFDQVLRQAVHWREFPDGLFESQAQWRLATRYTQVVMDWAPDCDPTGRDLDRMTVRFGVRAEVLKGFSRDWIVRVEDLGEIACCWRDPGDPPTPVMAPYPLTEPGLAERLLWSPAS